MLSSTKTKKVLEARGIGQLEVYEIIFCFEQK